MIANVNRNPKRRRKAYTPDDFLPPSDGQKKNRQIERPEQSPEQMLAICQALFGPVQGERLAIAAPSDE